MATAGKIKLYNDFMLNALKAAFGGTIKAKLATSAGNANTLSTTGAVASLTGEVSGSGYSEQTLTSVTWTKSGNVCTLDSDDIAFDASGGDITFRNLVLYTTTTLNSVTNPLIGTALADPAPADAVITDGNTGTFQINASGLLTVTSPTSDT